MAQLAGHLVANEAVTGSNPVIGSKPLKLIVGRAPGWYLGGCGFEARLRLNRICPVGLLGWMPRSQRGAEGSTPLRGTHARLAQPGQSAGVTYRAAVVRIHQWARRLWLLSSHTTTKGTCDEEQDSGCRYGGRGDDRGVCRSCVGRGDLVVTIPPVAGCRRPATGSIPHSSVVRADS